MGRHAWRGLSRLDNITGKFISYAEPEGIANAVIYKILEDASGRLWMSTNKGISSFDSRTGKFKNYGSDNGVQRSTYVLGAGLKTLSGELFFGGLDGFNYFNPGKFNCNRNIPGIVLTDLKVSNASVVPSANAPIKEHISIAREIRLDYKQNFSIDFVALNYSAPQESRYSYMLEGFDKSWNQGSNARTAVFSNLDPGTYIFRVKATSDDGSWTTPATSIKIVVRPPFYLTVYAYFAYIIAAALLLWGLRYRAIRKIKNKFTLEQERLQVKQMIEQKNREAAQQHEFEQAKIKYLMNVSHEFRTPVSLIMGPVERLLQQENNQEKQAQLSLIRRNARRLLNLVNQVLDFRKLEDHETKLNLAGGDIIVFLKEAVASFKDISERKHINFTFTSSLHRYNTAFDADKIERILFNLLSNAFKFTPKGGDIRFKIEQVDPQGLRFVVSDTGIGMEPDAAEKIFDRFFQGSADPGILNQGSGIGLSITKEFVKLHGGTICVDSVPGRGSVFTVQLPLPLLAEAINDTEPCNESAESLLTLPYTRPANGIPPSEMLTLLLVEDNEDFRYYLKDNLRHYYKIIEAADGEEGWQKALSAHPQVIVSDISMPYMDGIELCRKIKSDKRTGHIPIILLTALTGDANQLKGLETGANDYLTKPFNFQILNARIRNLFDLNQSLKNTYTRQLKIVSPDIEFESEDEKLMLAVSQYIEANLTSPKLSVEDLSRHVCMSRGSFYNKIVTLTGETPVEFIRSVKLNKAAALLENSDMKIAQVGYAVGFTTPNYFARAFKAKFNMLPSEYLLVKRHATT
jgi:signal transduction histidine kinase/DNA-binding response OmpR family regulator